VNSARDAAQAVNAPQTMKIAAAFRRRCAGSAEDIATAWGKDRVCDAFERHTVVMNNLSNEGEQTC
jgi:hypothetical protein